MEGSDALGNTSDARTARLCIDCAMALWARIIEHRKGGNKRSFRLTWMDAWGTGGCAADRPLHTLVVEPSRLTNDHTGHLISLKADASRRRRLQIYARFEAANRSGQYIMGIRTIAILYCESECFNNTRLRERRNIFFILLRERQVIYARGRVGFPYLD